MGEALKTAPVLRPVSLAEARQHCKIDDTEEDSLLLRSLDVAVGFTEDESGRRLITQTWYEYLPDFPVADGGLIRLPNPPLASVTALTYTDANGDGQTLTEDEDFIVTTKGIQGLIKPYEGTSWPAVQTQAFEQVVIEYVCGYGDNPSDVPAAARQLILLLASHMYANREPVLIGPRSGTLEFTIKTLLAQIAVPLA